MNIYIDTSVFIFRLARSWRPLRRRSPTIDHVGRMMQRRRCRRSVVTLACLMRRRRSVVTLAWMMRRRRSVVTLAWMMRRRKSVQTLPLWPRRKGIRPYRKWLQETRLRRMEEKAAKAERIAVVGGEPKATRIGSRAQSVGQRCRTQNKV